MAEITYEELRKKYPLLDWFLIHAITIVKAVPDIKRNAKNESILDIRFIVNGIELPVFEVFQDIEKQDNHRIKTEAIALLTEKINDFDDFIDGVKVAVIRACEEKLGINISLDDI